MKAKLINKGSSRLSSAQSRSAAGSAIGVMRPETERNFLQMFAQLKQYAHRYSLASEVEFETDHCSPPDIGNMMEELFLWHFDEFREAATQINLFYIANKGTLCPDIPEVELVAKHCDLSDPTKLTAALARSIDLSGYKK